MNYYFDTRFINGNELVFVSFVVIIIAIIVFTIFAVKREIKNDRL